MAIKRTKYNYTVQNGTDTFHFQTDDKQVKILDANNNILGSFKEFGMEGKVVTSGSFTNLKVTGMYKVTGLSGLPSGYDTNKISILSVKSVGEINNPEMSFYTLISNDGEVYENTVVGIRQSGWSPGGVNLENKLSSLTASIGNTSNLRTNAKASLVNAINEVHDHSTESRSRVNLLREEFDTFKGHNHDERYIRKSGDEMTGHLAISNNNFIRTKSANGSSTYNLIGVNNSNTIAVGDSGRPLILNSSDLRTSGDNKVWHEGNDGQGSGLDADLLGGSHSSNFAKLTSENRFGHSIYTTRNFYTDEHLVFGTSWSGRKSRIWAENNGEINIGDSAPVKVSSAGRILVPNDIRIRSNGSFDPSIRIKGDNSSGDGAGFVVGRSSGDLVLRSWDRNEDGFRFRASTNMMEFERPIHIQGRRLYLQNARPTGSIPTGSIWIS